MPENICMAARFASLEQAGLAYRPILELMRLVPRQFEMALLHES